MSALQERIAELAEHHGSLRAAARVLMVDHTYLHRLSTGEKDDPGDDLLRKLKLRRVVTYERSEPTADWNNRHTRDYRGWINELLTLADHPNANMSKFVYDALQTIARGLSATAPPIPAGNASPRSDCIESPSAATPDAGSTVQGGSQ